MRPPAEPLLIRSGRVVDPSQDLDATLDVLLADGEVAKLGENLSADADARDAEVLDASGRVVAPGFLDARVHLREPGFEHKETIATALAAAASGGFTAVAALPDTEPVHDRRSVTEHVLSEAARRDTARVWPIGAVSKGLAGEELAEVGEMVGGGAVAMSDGDRPVAHPELMRRALLYSRHFDIPLIQSPEDRVLAGSGVMHEGEWSTRLGLPGVAAAAEEILLARDLILQRETGGRYHAARLSTAAGVESIRRAKAEIEAGERPGRVTGEVTPHHLLLTDRFVHDSVFSTAARVTPPLRSEKDRVALLGALADGTVDALVSDHAPHHPDEKDVEFLAAPVGVVGLETTVSLALDRLVRPGVITLSRLVGLLSTGPARVLGVAGGSLAPGSPADVTLLDLEAKVTIDPAHFRSKGRSTPFAGWELVGAPVGTVVGGRRVTLGR